MSPMVSPVSRSLHGRDRRLQFRQLDVGDGALCRAAHGPMTGDAARERVPCASRRRAHECLLGDGKARTRALRGERAPVIVARSDDGCGSRRQSASLNRRRLFKLACDDSAATSMPFNSATACATNGSSDGSLYGRVLPAFLGRR